MSDYLSTLHQAHVQRQQRLFPIPHRPKAVVAPVEALPKTTVTPTITARKFHRRRTTFIEINQRDAVSVRVPVSLRPNGLPSMAQVVAIVAQTYQIPIEALRGRSRRPEFCRPRQIAMYLCREVLRESYPRIAKAVGVVDHTTVIAGCRRILKVMRDDADFASDIPELEERICQ